MKTQREERKLHETMGLPTTYQYDPKEDYIQAGRRYRDHLEGPTLFTEKT